MYLEHFGLTDSPFKITPHTEVFFEGGQRGAILDALVYAVLQGDGLIKVTGEVGSGKTMLCRMLAERLPESVEIIYLAIPSLKRDEMLQAITEDLGLAASDQHGAQLLRTLQTHLIELHQAGRRVVILIDEAHAMPLESLEEIRLLSNLETQQSKLLQIVLFGQPELDVHLALQHMRQLKERITQSFKLEPLGEQEVHQYLNFRLRAAGYRGPELFDPRNSRLITRASHGLSRRINILADKTLLAAFADSTHDIKPSHVKAALQDSEFHQKPLVARKQPWVYPLIAIIGAIIGGILSIVYMSNRTESLSSAQHREPPAVTAANAPTSARPSPSQASTLPLAAPHHAAPVETISKPSATPVTATTATALISSTTPPLASETTTPPSGVATIVAAASPSPAPAVAPTASAALPSKPSEQNSPWQRSRDWLHAQPAQNWVIQLMLADPNDKPERTEFISRASATLGVDKVYEYPLSLNGAPKIGLLYGPFADRREAEAALFSLPQGLRQYQPYMRTVGVVRQEAVYN